jgi:hypothetical protein
LAFDYCGVTAAATIKHQSPTDELLSDVGQNEPKKEIKRKLTAGLDKLGFIEAQALVWVTRKSAPAL